MKQYPAKTINQLLSGDSGNLRLLVERARMLQHLTTVLRQHLPLAMRDHCSVSAVDKHTLSVCADSAAWASKLRFHAPTLVPRLCETPALCDLQQIRVKVAPAVTAATSPPVARHLVMSASGAQAIDGCAQAIRDPALKTALQRLATRARQRGR
ncbi:MAG: hypothetical protein FD165_1672 [Gammaproteobacteria bacterium]|nr:MAG: hypothetical protein FD165_1672 [Gammaproteobacteria bacterium]TND02680.1 MAG: hypothetical protein FD120_2141 [Gammaproteobacteria bacterium]